MLEQARDFARRNAVQVEFGDALWIANPTGVEAETAELLQWVVGPADLACPLAIAVGRELHYCYPLSFHSVMHSACLSSYYICSALS